MAEKKLIIPKQIVTSDDENTILTNHALEVEENIILQIDCLDWVLNESEWERVP